MLTNIIYLVVLLCLCTSQAQTPPAEGPACDVPGDTNGTCVPLYSCPAAAAYYLYTKAGLKSAVAELSNPHLCAGADARADDPLVCCTDCWLDHKQPHKNKTVFIHGVKYNKKGPKAWRKCLQYFRELPYPCHGRSSDQFSRHWRRDAQCYALQQRSFGIGGYAAERMQFPHMALLGYGETRESAQWLCGGAVVSERFILTAAHCSSTPSLGAVTYAGLGVLTRSELSDYWKVYKIKSVIKHPDYHSPIKYHDIALLETEVEINFGRSLLPACLHVGVVSTNYAVATGWGRLGHKGQLAEHLMVMDLDEYNDTLCSELFPPHRLLKNGYDVKSQSCYGRQDLVVDTCQGDSGGPLQRAVSECMHFVFGITSYGRDCGIPGNAGMYTRVSHYLPWIENIVWPDE